MRTNVVSCDSAAVTLLLGVLHVPQLYSLWGLRGCFREKTGRKKRQPRAVTWTGSDGRRRVDTRENAKTRKRALFFPRTKKSERGERSVR